jgi:hypothetical protein
MLITDKLITNIVLTGTLIFCLNTTLLADGTYAGASLELGAGARPLALGGAAAAMQNNPENFIYNPSSQAFLRHRSLSLMYAPTFASVREPLANYSYVGATIPLREDATISINWTRFTVDDIPLYPELGGNGYADRFANFDLRPDGTALGYFRDQEDVFYFTFAKMFEASFPLGWLFIDLPVQMPFGINFKVLRQSLYNSSASGLGLDIGTTLRFNLGTLLEEKKFGDLSIGFSILDATKTAIVWNSNFENRIEPSFLFGISYVHHLGPKDVDLNLFYTRLQKYDTAHLFGMELEFKRLALRIGRNRSGLTAGAGIRMWRLQVDYGFVTLDLDSSHRLSTCFAF